LLRCQRLSGFGVELGALVGGLLLPAGGVLLDFVAVDGEKGGFFLGMLNS
jgi:hypothetical protein